MSVTNNTVQNILNITNNDTIEVFSVSNKNSSNYIWNFSRVEMGENVDRSINYNYDVQAINITNALFCLWMFFALLNFSIYKNKKAKTSKQTKILVIYSLFCSIFPLIRILLTYAILFAEWLSTTPDDNLCEVLTDSANVFFYVTVSLIYVYPWLKQRYLYQQPLLERFNTKLVRVASAASLVFMALFVLFHGCVSIIPIRYKMDPETLQFMVANNEPNTEVWRENLEIAYYVTSGGTALVQIYLLTLLVRPLQQFRKDKLAQSSETSRKVFRTLRQAVVSFIVCFLATVAFSFLGKYVGLKENTRVGFRNSVFDIAMNVLLFSVVVSYENWWNILTFSLQRKPASEETSLVSSSGETKKFCKTTDSNV